MSALRLRKYAGYTPDVTESEVFMSRRLLAVALSALVGVAAAAEFQPIEERMSARDFRASGLDKLSAEELANLNRWMNGEEVRLVGSAPAGGDSASAGPEGVGFEKGVFDRPDGPEEITTRFSGLFDGWSGKTRFPLENGQEWRQIESGKLVVGSPMSNPQVTLKRGFSGVWRLQVEGYNSTVKVERVK